jgi:hypothetical protein
MVRINKTVLPMCAALLFALCVPLCVEAMGKHALQRDIESNGFFMEKPYAPPANLKLVRREAEFGLYGQYSYFAKNGYITTSDNAGLSLINLEASPDESWAKGADPIMLHMSNGKDLFGLSEKEALSRYGKPSRRYEYDDKGKRTATVFYNFTKKDGLVLVSMRFDGSSEGVYLTGFGVSLFDELSAEVPLSQGYDKLYRWR